MIVTWKERGLVLLAAAPLLGLVPMATGAHADAGVALRTASPKEDVLPGGTYAWTFKMLAKGPAKSGKAVFRMTMPRSLELVTGTRHCRSKGRKVVCRLGTVRKGQKVKGAIKAKVSRRADAGQKISARGTVTWGKARVTRRFPAVRVAKAAGLLTTEAAPATARAAAPGPVRDGGPRGG
ncbi:hypothetical protein [Actinomadura livida]|uniref:DUF11 domain-containing protein n=1 Tax=Actinomadura livida TaxID=79909 RepID=A0A7W7MXN7_9ACTN|nr:MULTISPECIES: hypothetical protein [Actinomadura]MBB4774079.1 hypothetical protein [Actinomadura catellatispora]GGT85050.1 hypothetical protein GCM10010208_04800 [Actinomadura livida]